MDPSFIRALQKIPAQFRERPGTRFTVIINGRKKPEGKDWAGVNGANYAITDAPLAGYLLQGHNYGVLTGHAGIVVPDLDDTARLEELGIMARIPITMQVKTGRGGMHVYLDCTELDHQIGLYDPELKGDDGEPLHLGEIQSLGQQVVGPGSIHPNGNKYEVINDAPIMKISKADLLKIFDRLILVGIDDPSEEPRRSEARWRSSGGSSLGDLIPIDAVAWPKNIVERHGSEVVGSHPMHGSENGKNFHVNTAKNCWHCFRARHDSGGGPLEWLAVEAGLISCNEAKPGCLKGDIFKKVLNIAREKGFDIPEATPRANREKDSRKEEPKGPTVIDAISALKGVCDGAKTKDGTGFNGFHAKTFKNIIDKAVDEGTLSPKEEKIAFKFLYTYKKQLNGLGIEYSAIVPIYRVPDQRSEEEIGIQVNNRRLNEVSADALKALIEHNTPPRIFSRAGSLVRLHENESLGIEPLYKEALGLELADATSFHRAKDENVTIVSPPMGVISYILAAHDWPELPEIKTIIETPVIRPDGSILLTPGYDGATKLYLSPIVDLSSLVIPEVLTQKHAEASARYILDEIFADFPFENNASRTNTLAALLSAIVRPMIKGNIPLFILDKPQAGTGASLIADIISTITTGKPACMWGMPETEDEWRKAITSALIDGSPIIVIDNVVGMLRSAALSRALTSKIWRDRLLGKSQMLDLPQEAIWIATGNNIQIGGDTARRSVWIRLDATCARPWTRTEFKHPDILGWIGENHDSIIAYLLIMARAWVQAGKPLGSIKLGGFNEWARVISGILEFAGVEDFMGNATQLYDEMDQDVQQWDAFLAEWMTFHDENPIKAAVLRDELTSSDSIYRTFRDAMPDDVASALSRTNAGSLKLSHVLRKHLNQVYPSGRKLTQEQDKHSKMVLWKVAGVCGCSEKSTSTPSGHFAGVAGVQDPTDKLFHEISLPVNKISKDNKRSGEQTPATPANQPEDSDCAKTQTPANRVKITDPMKIRFLKDYRTQIAKLGEPNSYVDKLSLAGEIAELQRWKAEDLVKRGIVELVA
jgi:hypothetical protein